MPILQVGKKRIDYKLRRSETATERKITITPESVEVMVLSSDSDDDIAGFLSRKRAWVFNTVREMEIASTGRHSVPSFITGSKVLYRGRVMPLTVRKTDADCVQVTYRNGFIVDMPDWAQSGADALVAAELKLWLKQRARRDVREAAEKYAEHFGLRPRSIRTAELTHGWGSCSPKGNITINWQLIFAPRKVLEYVVLHELAHLKVRNHGPKFWRFLSTLDPDYQRSKTWLEKHQSTLSADFLRCG